MQPDLWHTAESGIQKFPTLRPSNGKTVRRNMMSNQKLEKPVSQIPSSVSKVTEIAKTEVKEPKTPISGMTQREAVFQEVIRVLRDEKVPFDGTSTVKAHLNETRLAKIYEGLAQGFKAGKIQLKPTPSNQKKLGEAALLKTYIVGLVNNWVRRDSRLNGKASKKA